MSLLRCVLSFVLLVTLAGAVPLPENVHVSENSHFLRVTEPIEYRLPTNVIPTNYTIKLIPHIVPGNFTFTGESSIGITVKNNTNEIVLHAKNLTIGEDISLWSANANITKNLVITPSLENATDFLRLKLKPAIPAGNYSLKLTYTGSLNDDLNGFYRSSYINDDGEQVWLATTQFEPTWARQAFPCFDEPALKATFDISIKHFDNYTAVSNMPVASIQRYDKNDPKLWTKFEVTPPMSTYLVAFVVSDFTNLANDDRMFKVYSRKNLIKTGRYALSVGQKELEALENYTSIKYTLPKMDNFAIPDFRAGAMENWGIVTYRESSLMFKENVTSTAKKQGVATVISHEFAHQWFGDLVSPLWWDYAWLNEGFANYFQYYITDKVETTWRMMDQFVIKNLQETAFVADDNETQHSMDATVHSPDQISKIFDSITYSKAGSVIRMFSHVLGESTFKTGLNAYLTNNKNAAVSSDDLFKALKEAAGTNFKVNLTDSLVSWVRQPGYPVITVIRNHTTGAATITQKRFLTKTNKTQTELWLIPINYVTQDDPDFSKTETLEWLNKEQKPFTLTGLKTNNWVIFNKQQTGYYRVNYDAENWRLIAEYLKISNNTQNIHVLNRAQLLDDSFNLAQAGELQNHTAFLEITEYLQHEDDYVPWYAAYRAFSVLNKALANTDKYSLFKLYILRLTEKLEKTVGYNETAKDDHTTKFNRLNAVNLACTMGSPACLAATFEKLVDHVAGSNNLSADLQSVVLCAGIRSANATIWEKTYNLTSTMCKDSDDWKNLVKALGCSSDANILKQYLEKTLLTESDLSREDVVKAVLDGSAGGIDVAFEFITGNYQAIVNDHGNTDKLLGYLNEIGSRMTIQAQVDKLEAFIKKLPTDSKPLADALTANALASAKKNVKWLEAYEPEIASFLDAQKLGPDVPPVTDKPNSSNIYLPSISLTGFIILVAALGARIN